MWITPVAVVLAAFTLYYLVISDRVLGRFFPGKPAGYFLRILSQRLAGVFFFGILPLAGLLLSGDEQPATFGFTLTRPLATLGTVLLLCPVMFLIGYFAARSPGHLRQYPQMRINEWPAGLFALSILSWGAYLMAYEFLFRGYLLFAVADTAGIPEAVIINTVLYAVVHLPKGWKETVGALPFGALICVLTLLTGNILTAFLAHWAMAFSNEYFSIRNHPDMKFTRKTVK